MISCLTEYQAVVEAAKPFESHFPEGFKEAGHGLDDVFVIGLLARSCAYCLKNNADKEECVKASDFEFESFSGDSRSLVVEAMTQRLDKRIEFEDTEATIQDVTMSLLADVDTMQENDNLVELMMFYLVNDLTLLSMASEATTLRDILEDAFNQQLAVHDEAGIVRNFIAKVDELVNVLSGN